MEKLLHLFKYVDGVNDTPFPSKEQQGILYDFKYDAERMGNVPTITGTLMHPLCLDDEWGDGRVYVLFNNEKYFLKQTPTSSYSNEDTRYKHELDLVSERTILNDVYFYDVVASDVSNDKPVSNSSNFSFYGDIHEFAQRLNYSLQYANVGYSVVVDGGITSDAKVIAFQDQYIMDVLQEIYKTYEIPFYFVGKVIHIGYTNSSIETPFKYGVRDALLSISKNNITQKIVNRITGIGSSDNIPYYYPNFDPKGETEILLRGEPTNVVTIENLNAYKKVKLSDKFIYSSESSYRLDYIDKSKYSVTKEPYLVSEPNASTRIWEVILDFPFSVDIYQDSYIEIGYSKGDDGFTNYQARLYRNSELRDRFDAFGTIPYYRLIEGNYNFSFTLRYEFKEGSEKQDLTMEDIPNIVNNALELSIYANVEGYKQWTLNKASNVVELSKFGLKYNGTPHNGDIITFKQLSYITPQPNLMPPIYRETKANERFYNALNNTYLNPSTNNYYHFESPFVVGKPKEQIVSFEDIKPSIVGITNASGLRIDMFSEFAYDTNDNDEFDEEGNYLHPYFFAKLRKFDGDFGFNLFEHSIEEDEMVISMTSGSCGSCNFVIGVDKETQKNIVQVDENGDLLRDSNGNVLYGSPQEIQNDTINNEVWIALKKDIETFGVIMPNANNNYRPNVSDTFVILHIDLPKDYIFVAENQLKEALIEYMFENNSEKFNFSINFSRIYFAENPNILAQLNENSHIRLEYNNIVYSLYVSSFAYSMSNDNPLPEIKIELSKDLTIKKESILTQLSNASKQLVVTIKRVDSSINATNKDVAKTTSTTMTSISETNARVDNVEKVLRDIQDGNGTSSGGGNGSINYDDLEDYLTQEEYAKKEDIPSLDGYVTNDDLNNKGFATEQWVNNKGYLTNLALNGYATENWVRNQGYLTQHQDLSAYAKSEDIAKTYATKVELSTTNTNLSNLLASHNILRSDFDNLNNLLNSDVNSTIDTWNEVVAFLDGYSDSDDLATILSQMNTDITNKVGYDEFEKVSDATKDLLSYFDVNGYALNAINALKLGGIDAGNYWHKGNSGTLDYDWKAKKLNVRTLVIPTSEPTDLSQGEVGFYLGTAGQGAEEPNGSGGLDLTELWAELSSEDYAKKIHISHIPTIQYSSIAGRPSALANPHPLTINKVVYDGSEPITLNIGEGGGVADSVAWGNVFNKPTTISGYGITDAYTKDSVDLKLSNYLPKSGGTISGGHLTLANTARLKMNSGLIELNDGDGTNSIYLGNARNIWGENESKNLCIYDGSWHRAIHSGNYSSYALSLSGGTIGYGVSGVALTIDRASTNPTTIRFNSNGSLLGYIGFDTEKNAIINVNSAIYTLIHSGNIGKQSVSYANNAGNASTLNGYDQYGFYRSAKQGIPSGDLALLVAGSYYAGGLAGDINPLPITYASLSVFGQSYYSSHLCVEHNANRAWLRGVYNTSNGVSATDWHEIAFKDGNIASATKLNDNTAFTAWGQTFFENGVPKKVSGNLSLGVYRVYWNNELEEYYIGLDSNFYLAMNGYLGLRFLVNKSEKMRISQNGNVLIGTTDDNGYKLQVNGTFKANGLIIPTSAPTDLKAGDHALYLGSVGEGAELPSGAGGLDVAELWAELGKVDESKQINVSHIPTIEIARVSGLQTALNNKADASALSSYQPLITNSNKLAYSLISGTPTLASVATSGKYSDLSGVPTSLPASDVYAWAKAATKPSYTASEVGALSTSGGTLTFTGLSGLTLKRTTNNSNFIHFTGGDADFGYLGFASVGIPVYADYNGYTYTLIHTGNYAYTTDNRYLQLSGGTIIGSYNALSIKRNNAYASLIQFENTDGVMGYLGFNSANVPVAYNRTADTMYTLIHSGNIGSQVVEGINTHVSSAINAGGDIAKLNSYYKAGIFKISRFNGLGGLGTANSDGLIINWPLDHAYGQQWYMDDESHIIQTRYMCNGSWSSFRTIAFTDSNVASATKLQTARTIWGQNFDGSADVSGNIHLGNGAAFEVGTGYNAGDPTRYNKIVFGAASTGLQYISGSWTNADVVVHDFKVGSGNTTALAITNNGNVLIGTTSDSGYKLVVNGSLNATTIHQNGTAIGLLAFKNSLVASDIPNLSWSKITSGKPTTLSGYGITDALKIVDDGNNYLNLSMPSTALSQKAANTYIECWDGAGWWNWMAGKWITAGGTSSHFVKGDGSLDGTAYLPLSGGRMTNGITWADNIRSWDSPVSGFEMISTADSALGYWCGISAKGYYGLQIRAYGGDSDNLQIRGGYYSSWGTWRNIIHSGNIGSQSVSYASNAGQLGGYAATTYPTYEEGSNYIAFNLRSNYTAKGQGNGHIEFYDNGWYNCAWGKVTAVNGFVGNLSGNAASATKLQTTRTIWGQSFDGTGDVSGAMSGVNSITSNTTNGYFVGNRNNGLGVTTGGLLLYSYNATPMSFWTNKYERMHITAGGNILIGTTTDWGFNLASIAICSAKTLGYLGNGGGAFFGSIAEGYGTAIWTQGNGNGYIQQGRSNGEAVSYNLVMQHLGGNVLIGTTTDNGSKLQVNGAMEATELVIPTAPPTNPQPGKHYLYLA